MSDTTPRRNQSRALCDLTTAVKTAALDRAVELLDQVGGIPRELLDGKHHPCPRCRGTDRFRLIDADRGAVLCNQCFREKNGDWIAAVMWMHGWSFSDAVRAAAEYLGVDPGKNGPSPQRDIIAAVCADKRMPEAAFRMFGAEPAMHGKLPVARVPVYNQTGKQHSYFDLPVGKKGWWKAGTGSTGMFFPGQLPKPGETWCVAEGVKDPAALVGLGYLAAGMPNSKLNAKYARLFTGCHVVLVHDLDKAGLNGTQGNGGQLVGIAASVRVARLPGEIVEIHGDDVRDVLSKPAGEQSVRQAIEDAAEWTPAASGSTAQRRAVEVSFEEATVASIVIDGLGQLGWSGDDGDDGDDAQPRGRIYQRTGQLVHVTQAVSTPTCGIVLPEHMLRIRPLPAPILRERITSAVVLVKPLTSDDDEVMKRLRPAHWLVNAIHQRGEYPPCIRSLAGVVRCPTLRPDGSVIQVAGYDDATGLLYVPDGKYPEIPDRPSRDDARRAADELLDVVADFPFVGVSQSVWLSLVLTLVARPAIAGPCPLFAFDANTPASGKSLLCDVAAVVAYGDRMPRKAWVRDDEEMRKVITSVALEAIPVVLFDNVSSVLGSSSLDAALTGTTWTDRILGKSKTTGVLPLTTVWAVTGNNLVIGGDTPRRTLFCRLESAEEHPEERQGFTHPDLVAWVRKNRHPLAVAAVMILRGYIVAGRPDMQLAPWGSYEAWSALIRQAIVWVDVHDPGDTRTNGSDADRSTEVLRLLLDGIVEVDPGDGVTAVEIERVLSRQFGPDDVDQFPALRAAVAEMCSGRPTARSIGYRLRSYLGRVCGGRRLARNEGHGRVRRWSVEQVGGGKGASVAATTPETSSPSSPSSPVRRVRGVL